MNNQKKVTIIAEAGVNHNGDIRTALDLVEAASDVGADIIKFQTFITESIVTKYSKKANYQKRNNSEKDDSQFSMLKKLELSIEDHKLIIDKCKSLNIEFLSTGFDLESLDLLCNLGLKRYKIPSGEINNLPYLRKISEYNKPIIMSTGMATIDEIEAAFNILIDCGIPSNDLTILQCTSEYPAPIDEINLKVMSFFQKKFKVNVGISDHSEGIEVAIAATALGASVVEKHLTLDKRMIGPDHKASIEPVEFKKMVIGIKKIEKALGFENKIITKSEVKNKNIVRKSLVAAKKIKKGELFTKENIGCKRPGYGISPMKIDQIIGNVSQKDYQIDEMIEI
tara:strand:+ start:735 stop:1751 length:1017 start_codon:yes stop_codon:yes gene_type:complete